MSDKLTKQELSWLLTQEARGAAERLRKGVQILTREEAQDLDTIAEETERQRAEGPIVLQPPKLRGAPKPEPAAEHGRPPRDVLKAPAPAPAPRRLPACPGRARRGRHASPASMNTGARRAA